MHDYTKELERTVEELQQRLAKLEIFNEWRDLRHVQRLRFSYCIRLISQNNSQGDPYNQDYFFSRPQFKRLYGLAKINFFDGMESSKEYGYFYNVDFQYVYKCEFAIGKYVRDTTFLAGKTLLILERL